MWSEFLYSTGLDKLKDIVFFDTIETPDSLFSPLGGQTALIIQKLFEAGIEIHTTEDVILLLQLIGLEQYEDAFRFHQVDLNMFNSLTVDEIRNELGIKNLKHRRKLNEVTQFIRRSQDQEVLRLHAENGLRLCFEDNVRQLHTWIRLGISLLFLSVVSLRMFPDYMTHEKSYGLGILFTTISLITFTYAIRRYLMVVHSLQSSETGYFPDHVSILVFVLMSFIITVGVLMLVFY